MAIKQEPRKKILKIMAGEWLARACYVAAKLQIADHLSSGPKTIQELVELTKTHKDSLQRLLRLLISEGVFHEDENAFFFNNSASELLSKDNPQSLRNMTIYRGEFTHKAWDKLLPAIKKGTPAFELATGLTLFQYIKEHPLHSKLFHEAMKDHAKATINDVISTFDFSNFKTVCDVGGGHGHFIHALLAHYPKMKGILVDLPEIIEVVKNDMNFPHDRCELLAQDFFAKIPKNADAYLLKNVLHDWDDEHSIAILKNCKAAIPKNGRVLLVEIVLLPGQESSYSHHMDFLMLSVAEGRERTLASWKKILDDAGFVLETIHPTSTEWSVIQCRLK